MGSGYLKFGDVLATFSYSEKYKKLQFLNKIIYSLMSIFLLLVSYTVIMDVSTRASRDLNYFLEWIFLFFVILNFVICLYGLLGALGEEKYQIYKNGVLAHFPIFFNYLGLKSKFFISFAIIDKIEIENICNEEYRLIIYKKKAFLFKKKYVIVEEGEKAYQATIDAFESWKKKNQHLINSQAEI